MTYMREQCEYDGVPSQYVHRNTMADVLLTDWWQIGSDAFTLRARWPASHTLFSDTSGQWRHDPLLIAETVRQAGLLIAHAEYHVPRDQHFLMHELNFSVLAESMPVAGRAAELELHLVGHDVRRRGESLSSMRYEVGVAHRGRLLGGGGAGFSCATPSAYRRLRGAHLGATPPPQPQPQPPDAIPPRDVGRDHADDVVLARGIAGHQWQLRVDPAHRALADHPVDHVPGMLLIEAARQAAEAVTDPGQVLAVNLTSSFHRYVEYDEPCWINADRGPTDAQGNTLVRVAGRQGDQLMFDVTLTVRQHGTHPPSPMAVEADHRQS